LFLSDIRQHQAGLGSKNFLARLFPEAPAICQGHKGQTSGWKDKLSKNRAGHMAIRNIAFVPV
ncbi:MAG: hypothetical protein WC861_07245, partial [Candidatus Micrarchaeia archaeon]